MNNTRNDSEVPLMKKASHEKPFLGTKNFVFLLLQLEGWLRPYRLVLDFLPAFPHYFLVSGFCFLKLFISSYFRAPVTLCMNICYLLISTFNILSRSLFSCANRFRKTNTQHRLTETAQQNMCCVKNKHIN